MRAILTTFRRVSPMQILLMMVLVVAMYFAVAFSGELIASHRIDQQVASLTAEIGTLKARNTQLKADVAEASSDAYVERQAREELGLVRPGDTPVVITNAPTPAPPPPAPTPTPEPHWAKWRDLLARQTGSVPNP